MHRGTTEAVNERVRRPGLWVLALAPLAMYVIFESATGNLLQIRGIPLILNLIFFYMFYSLGFVLTNSSRVTCIFLNTLLTVLAPVSYTHLDVYKRQEPGARKGENHQNPCEDPAADQGRRQLLLERL